MVDGWAGCDPAGRAFQLRCFTIPFWLAHPAISQATATVVNSAMILAIVRV